jgi:hypothetical protein
VRAANGFHCPDDAAPAGGGGRSGAGTVLARATLDNSWVSRLLPVGYLLNTLFLYPYGH